MPLSVLTTDPLGKAVFVEWSGPNGTGNQEAPVGAVTYASDNEEVATIDPNTGAFTAYVGAGTTNISAKDAGDNLVASDVLTVSVPPPPPPQSATLTLVAGS